MEQERTERVYEVSHVIVTKSNGRVRKLFGVEEIVYAERFVLITHRDDYGGGSIIRSTFPYEHLFHIDTHMKPDMPLLGGVEEDEQDEVARQDDAPLTLNSLREATARMMED